MLPATVGFELHDTPVVKAALSGQLPEAAGKAVVLVTGDQGWPGRRIEALRRAKPALLIVVDRSGVIFRQAEEYGIGKLLDPEAPGAATPWLLLHHQDFAHAVEGDLAGATLTAQAAQPVVKPVKVRNVIAVLRGSDPALRDSYVLVTAHYDHVGVKPGCKEGDLHLQRRQRRCQRNGLGDGSGGGAGAAGSRGPSGASCSWRCSGRKRGWWGARYYVRHPVFPLARTVADVNLEQLGAHRRGGRRQSRVRHVHRLRVFQPAGGCSRRPAS